MCLFRGKQEKTTALFLDEHIKQELKDVIMKNSRPRSSKPTKMSTAPLSSPAACPDPELC